MAYIVDLPVEILIVIFALTDVATIVRIRRTCHLFRHISENSLEIKYMFALYAHNLVDGNSLIVREPARRYDLISDHRAAWRNIQWRPEVLIDPRFVRDDPEWRSRYNDSIFVAHSLHRLLIIQIPSRIRQVPMKQWIITTQNGLTPRVKNLGFAPNQDILIWTDKTHMAPNAVRMYPRSLTTGQRHPLAQVESWIVNCPEMSEIQWGDIHVYGDLVGQMCTDVEEFATFHVFNWKTGQDLFDCHMGVKGYAFVNEQYVALLVSENDGDYETLQIEIYDVVNCILALVLKYPSLAYPTMGGDLVFDMKTDYNQPHPDTYGTFHTSNADRLVVVTIEDIVDGTQLAYVHAIPNSRILELLAMHPIIPQPPQAPGFATIEFNDWAPQHTRLIERPAHGGFFFNIQGMRLILPLSPPAGQTLVMIYDFYQPQVRMLAAIRRMYPYGFEGRGWPAADPVPVTTPSRVGGGEEQLLIEDPSEAPEDGYRLGDNTFTTYLPYVGYMQSLPGGGQHLRGAEVQIGEDALIYMQGTGDFIKSDTVYMKCF